MALNKKLLTLPDQLNTMLGCGKHATRKLSGHRSCWQPMPGETDEAIAANVSIGLSTVYRIKRCFVLGNLEAALTEAPRPGAKRKLTGKQQALLVLTACVKPPAGRSRRHGARQQDGTHRLGSL